MFAISTVRQLYPQDFPQMPNLARNHSRSQGTELCRVALAQSLIDDAQGVGGFNLNLLAASSSNVGKQASSSWARQHCSQPTRPEAKTPLLGLP